MAFPRPGKDFPQHKHAYTDTGESELEHFFSKSKSSDGRSIVSRYGHRGADASTVVGSVDDCTRRRFDIARCFVAHVARIAAARATHDDVSKVKTGCLYP